MNWAKKIIDMKKIITILTAVILLAADKVNGQVVTFSILTTPPTCSTCCNGSFTVTMAGCSSYTIGTTPFIGAPTMSANVAVYSNVCNGTYTVMVIGSTPCGSASQVCTMTYSPTGISVISSETKEVVIFPNPATEKLFTNIDGTKIIKIVDLNGKVLLNVTTNDKEVSTKELPKGIYFISIYTDKNLLLTRDKIILE